MCEQPKCHWQINKQQNVVYTNNGTATHLTKESDLDVRHNIEKPWDYKISKISCLQNVKYCGTPLLWNTIETEKKKKGWEFPRFGEGGIIQWIRSFCLLEENSVNWLHNYVSITNNKWWRQKYYAMHIVAQGKLLKYISQDGIKHGWDSHWVPPRPLLSVPWSPGPRKALQTSSHCM